MTANFNDKEQKWQSNECEVVTNYKNEQRIKVTNGKIDKSKEFSNQQRGTKEQVKQVPINLSKAGEEG